MDQVAQGKWSSEEKFNNINWLKQRVIELAPLAFQNLIQHRYVLIKMDKITAKAHVNCQGGTRVASFLQEAVHISQ